MSCVYKHTFPNGAVYIGKTNMTPERRWLNGWGYKNSPLMFNAIMQFGWLNVKHEIIADNLTEEEALALETKEIAKHSKNASMTYNMAQIPPEYLVQENKHFIDVPAQSILHEGVSAQSSPQNDAQSHAQCPQQSSTKRTHYKYHIIPLTPKPMGNGPFPIDVYSTAGDYIATFPSGKIAARELNVNHGDVVSCCKGIKADGKGKYQVKGYVFRYHI